MKRESHLRSIIKGVTWRFIATGTTITVAYLITGEIEDALKIGMWEFLIKFLVYYLHERVWQFAYQDNVFSKKETLMKTITWRIVASTTTFIISLMVIGEGNAGAQATWIMVFEASSKMVFFYIHERLWLRVPLGTIRNIGLKFKGFLRL